VFLKKLFTER